ncbi:MAG: HEAT repeat domain-containing protein [Planctomycetes bacterium]|nr:HEAT repeat domain-containing protein [Planctomycetota bacterium]
MHAPFTARAGQATSMTTFGLRLAVLLLPAVLLLVGSLRYHGDTGQILLFGAAFQMFVCTLGLLTQAFWRRSVGPAVILFYGIAFAWLFLGTSDREDWYLHLAQALLLVIPLSFFAVQTLYDIGAPALRRARLLAQRLADRKEWPADLDACRTLPEVKALREALHLDAGPAIPLLHSPRPPVQIAALAALDFRKHWRPGQAEAVLQVALRAEQSAVRAAALSALANIEDRVLIESLAEFLRDPSSQVRRAATEALLWDSERRWAWIRYAVRRSLGDPLCQEDGPLQLCGQPLPGEAVDDLTAWASEKGLLGLRAALTLGRHYNQALAEAVDAEVILSLRDQLADPHAPPVLRMELARLLNSHAQLERETLHHLLDPANPAPLRLIAVEALLADGQTSVEAMTALRELARLPNREIALATADVVQRRLKVDLGLVAGQPLPPLHSRQATEISRRVRSWASQYDLPEDPAQPFARVENRSWHSIGEI